MQLNSPDAELSSPSHVLPNSSAISIRASKSAQFTPENPRNHSTERNEPLQIGAASEISKVDPVIGLIKLRRIAFLLEESEIRSPEFLSDFDILQNLPWGSAWRAGGPLPTPRWRFGGSKQLLLGQSIIIIHFLFFESLERSKFE